MKATKLMERPAATMKLVGGRLCLDFVNTVGGRLIPPGNPVDRLESTIRNDKLGEYADLVAWGVHAKLLSEKEAESLALKATHEPGEAVRIFQRGKELREAIHRVCRSIVYGVAPEEQDVAFLNAEIAEARSHQRLAPNEKQFIWQWEDGTWLDRMLWPVALSAAELLTEDDLSRLRECGGDECHWLFEDTSRNGRRQWCTMEDCGNVAKVRKFRERKRMEGRC
jgi:predicted RNA-binding Zn ribbon-like protein